MKLLKRIVAVLTVLFMLLSVVYAEETDSVSFLATKEGDNITIVEQEHVSAVDNSDLYVQVVRHNENGTQLLYTGPLGGYDNGKWSDRDFSKVKFLVIFDWERPEDGGVYIFPVEEDQVLDESNVSPDEGVSDFQLENLEIIQPSLNISGNFFVNNHEITDSLDSQNIQGNDNVLARYFIANEGEKAQYVQLMLCAYSPQGKLMDMAVISDTVSTGETKTLEKYMTIDSDVSICYIKVFLWDGLNSLRPLHDTIQIGSENINLDISTATIECEFNKEYNLVTTVENMPANDNGQYTISYNPSKLELIDLCSLTYKKELAAGMINGTNITIVSVDTTEGKITFENPNEEDNTISKVLNSFKFRGLVSGEQTTIAIE